MERLYLDRFRLNFQKKHLLSNSRVLLKRLKRQYIRLSS